MRLPRPKLHFSHPVKALVATGLVVITGSSVLAFNSLQPTKADEMTPTQITVQDHETRLDKNEADIADTKDRVTDVEQKTEQNTQETRIIQERVTVVEGRVQAPAQQAPAAPTPTPAPRVTNPRLVTGMTSEQKFDRFDTPTGWQCQYTLGDDINNIALRSAFQGYPCHEVGTEISGDLAVMWGIK